MHLRSLKNNRHAESQAQIGWNLTSPGNQGCEKVIKRSSTTPNSSPLNQTNRDWGGGSLGKLYKDFVGIRRGAHLLPTPRLTTSMLPVHIVLGNRRILDRASPLWCRNKENEKGARERKVFFLGKRWQWTWKRTETLTLTSFPGMGGKRMSKGNAGLLSGRE